MSRQTMGKTMTRATNKATAPRAAALVRCAFACVLALSLALPAEGLTYAFADAGSSVDASAATAAGEASVAAKDATPAAESGGSGDAVAPGEGDAAAADDSDAVGEPEDSGEVPAQGGEGEEQDAPEPGSDATDDDGPAAEAPEADAAAAEAASPDAASEPRASIYFRVTNDATGAAIGGNYTTLQDAIDACPVRKACTVKLVGGNYIIGPTTEAARTKMYQEITLTSDTGSRIIFRQQSNLSGKAVNRHIYVELYSKFVLKGIALEGPRKNAAGELDTSFLNEAGGVSSEGHLELGPGSVISFCSGSGVGENGYERGSVTINGGIVKKCYSIGGGGGVCCIQASFEMNSGNIEDNIVFGTNNFSVFQGGGLALYSTDNMGTPFVINGGTIRNNTIEYPSTWKTGSPGSQGGGVYVGSGHLIMTGGAITGNSAFDGGGVALSSAGYTSSSGLDDARFTMTGGTITGNTALCDGGGIVCFPYNSSNLSLGGSMKGYYAEPMLDDLSDGDNPYRNLRISGSATVSGNHATLSGAVVPPSNAASYNALFPGSLLNNNEVNYRRSGDEMSVVPNNGTSEPNVVFRCDDPWTNWRDRFSLTASMFSGLTPPTINTHVESLNTAADGSGTSYQVPSTDNQVPLMREPTTTLYAQWSINQATIEFDSQGGVPASQTITVDVDDPINWFPPVEKHGQVLLGWFTQPSGGTEVHTTDTPLTLDPSVQHGDTITVYAHWVDAVCQRITPNPYGGEYLNGTYATFEEGFGAMRGGDRLELIRNAELSSRAQSYLMGGNGTRTVTTAPTVNPVSGACEWLGPAPAAGEAPRAEIRRSSASGSIVVAGSGSSTITADFENVIIDGGSKASVPIAGTVESLLVTTGIASLRLGDGAVVRNVMATCATASGTAVGQPIFIDSTPDPSTGKSFIIDDGALIEDLHITTTSGGLGSGTMSPISVCTSGVKVLMKGGTVRNCSSNMNGGAFGIWNTTNSLEIGGNAVVENNHADFRGGAVYGYVELKDNAVVRNNTAGEAGGGVFGTGSIAGDALIQGNRAPAGGGIYAALVSINSGFKFQGGRITGNTATGIGGVYPSVTPSAASGGGGVYTDFYLPSSEFSGNPVIWGNTGALGDDNMLVGIDASVLPADVVASKLKVVSPGMDPNAKVGVNVALANMLPYQVPSDYLGLGARFGVYSPLALNQFLDAFIDDIDHSLLGADGGAVGTSVANTGHAVWGTAVCQIIRPNATTGTEEFWRGYTSVQNAVAAAQDGDRIELLKDVDLNGPAVGDWASGTVELTTAPVIQPVAGASAWQGLAGAGVTPRATVSCTAASSGMSVQGGGELATKNVVFKQPTGAPSMLGSLFLLQNASSLTLDDGTEVKDFKLAVGALIASDGSACEVLFEPGSSVHDSREVVHLAGQGDVSVRGGEFYAISGGTCVFNMDAGTKLAISGGSFHDNASRWEGGVVRSAGDVELTGGEFFDNKAADGYRGGAVFVYDSSGGTDVNSFSIGGNVHVHDNSVKGNVSTGAVHAAGIPAIIEGSPVIEDNVKYKVDGSLEEGHYDYFLDTASTLAVSGALGTSASIGIRTVVVNNPGDQFATYDAGANVNLDKFFDNANPLLVGSDGGSGRAIWKLALVDTSFTKVGASQEPGGAHGLYSGLPGAKFNVYEYVGAEPLTQAALDSGAVGPASTSSTDWAPLLDAAGTAGTAGNTSNVPHEFASDPNGKVDLAKVKPGAWYMLVEAEAPAGYQLPEGQWAFQVSDPDGDGAFDIDASNVLACKGVAGGGALCLPLWRRAWKRRRERRRACSWSTRRSSTCRMRACFPSCRSRSSRGQYWWRWPGCCDVFARGAAAPSAACGCIAGANDVGGRYAAGAGRGRRAMKRKILNMRANMDIASRIASPKAGSLLRCAFACALALSLALPAEGLSYAFADAAGSDAAPAATVEAAEGGEADAGGAAGSDAQAGLLAEQDAPPEQDAPAAAHPSEDAPLLMSLHGMRAAEAAETAPAAEEDASAAAEGEPAAEGAEADGSGAAGPEGSGPEGGAEDPGASDGSGAPDGEDRAEPGEGAQDGADADDPIVMEAPEAEAPEDAEGAAPLSDAPEPRAGGTYVVTRTAGGASIGSYATIADAVAACPSGTACTVTLTGADDTAMGDQVTVAAGQDITLTSDTGARQIIQTLSDTSLSGGRGKGGHFAVLGKLTLRAIVLTAPNQVARAGYRAGGVFCAGGTLVMEPGSVISKCYGSTFKENASGLQCGLEDDSSRGGGGVCVAFGGRFEMNGGVIERCGTGAGGGGGGVFLWCFGSDNGSIEINDGEIKENKYGETKYGGGIGAAGRYDDAGNHESGTITINGGRIADNKAKYGGGVGLETPDFGNTWFIPVVMTGGTIEGNNANADAKPSAYFDMYYGAGGGVIARNFSMSGGSIVNNKALRDGGGLCVPTVNRYPGSYASSSWFTSWSDYSKIRVTGSAVISGNKAGSTSPLPDNYTACDPYVPGALFNNDEISYRKTARNATFVANNGASPAQPDFVKTCEVGLSHKPDTLKVPSLADLGFTPPPHKHLTQWNEKADGTGQRLFPDDGSGSGNNSSISTVFYKDTTWYAIWASDAATVVYDAQGGAPAATTVSNVAVDGPIGTPPTVTKPGSVLMGWYTQPTGGTKVTSTSTLVGLNSSIRQGDTVTLYARWGDPVCQIIHTSAGGAETFSSVYGDLPTAFAAAQDGDRIEMLRNYDLSSGAPSFNIAGHAVFTTAPATQPVAGALPWQGTAAPAGEEPRAVVSCSTAPPRNSIDITGGGTLELENVVFSGSRVSLFRTASSGGYLVLGDGAEMRDGFGNLFLGTVANSGFTMKDGSLITGWENNRFSSSETRSLVEVPAGGTIAIEGGTVENTGAASVGSVPYYSIFFGKSSGSSISMSGGEVKGCTADSIIIASDQLYLSGGQVVDNFCSSYTAYAINASTLSVQGDPVVARNLSAEHYATHERNKANIFANSTVYVDGLLQSSAEIHISNMYDAALMADGAVFGSYGTGFGANANVFANDANGLRGADAGGGNLRWGGGDALCQIIRTGASGTETFVSEYGSLQEAFDAAQDGDRIEMLRDMAPSGEARFVRTAAAEIVLTTAPVSNPVAGASGWKGAAPAAGEAPRAVLNGSTVFFGGDGLFAAGDQVRGVLKDVVLDGTDVLMEGNAGASLGSGAWIRNVVGKSAIAYGASAASGGGLYGNWDQNDPSTFNKVEMLDGSRISDCEPGSTALIDIWDEDSWMCGVLYIRGGEIEDNVASQSVLIDTTVSVEQRGIFEMSGGSIKNNEAVSIAASGSSASVNSVWRFTISGGEVRGNRSPAAADPATGALCAPAFETFWLELSGGTITDNMFGAVERPEDWGSADTDAGGAVKASKFTLEGDPYVFGNTTLQGYPCDVSAANPGRSPMPEAGTLVLSGPLTDAAKVGVWKVSGNDAPSSPLAYDQNGHRKLGDKFSDYSATPGANVHLERLVNNTNGLVGVDDGAGGVVWGNPVCQRIATGSGTPTFVEAYGSMAGAFVWSQAGDRIEMLNDYDLGEDCDLLTSGSVELATAPRVQPVAGAQAWQGAAPAAGKAPQAVILRPDGNVGTVYLTGGGTLTVKNTVFDCGSTLTMMAISKVPLFLTDGLGGSLVLSDGAVVRNLFSRVNSYTYHAFLFGTDKAPGDFAMEAGSLITGITVDTGSGTSMVNVQHGRQVSISGGVVENCVFRGSSDFFTVGGCDDTGTVPSSFSMSGGEIRNNSDITGGTGVNSVIFRGAVGTFSGGRIADNTGNVRAFHLHGITGSAGIDSEFRLQGGEIVNNVGWGIYMGGSQKVFVQGSPKATGNVALDGSGCDFEISSSRVSIVVDGPLGPSADIGVSVGLKSLRPLMADGAQFASYVGGFNANVGAFKNLNDPSLTAKDWGNGKICWGDPSIQIIRPNASGADEFFGFYGSLASVFADAQDGDRVELLKDVDMSANAPCAWTSGTVELTTAPAVQPVAGAKAWQGAAPAAGEAPRATVSRTGGSVGIDSGGGLEVENVAFDGGSKAVSPVVGPLFGLDNSSSLSFGDGVELRNVSGSAVYISNSAGAASGCRLSFGPGGSFHGLEHPGGIGGLVYAAPNSNAEIEVTGGEFYDCSARQGGAFGLGAGTQMEVTGGQFRDNEAFIGGAIWTMGPLKLLDGEFHDNRAGWGSSIGGTAASGSGGAAAVSGATASLELGSANVHGNKAVEQGSGTASGGGISVNDGATASVSGEPLVTGNTAVDASDAVLRSSNLDFDDVSAGTLLDIAAPLSPSASVGVTMRSGVSGGHMLDTEQFGTYASGANANLNLFFNDLDPVLVGDDGGSGKAVWKAGLVDASFTKVGASQEPGAAHGLYAGLPGAKFNVYEYVGTTPLTQANLDSGAIGPANTASSDWAPLLDANGTVGTAGSASNVPHDFVSDSNGKVDLTKVKPNTWLMLVETEAPGGYQLPQGQWAFKVSDPDGDGTFDIDTSNVLACMGGGGSLPPAMATSVETSSGTRTGVFVVNTPQFDLPHAGVLPQLPLALLAGAALVAAAWALHRLRRRSRRA